MFPSSPRSLCSQAPVLSPRPAAVEKDEAWATALPAADAAAIDSFAGLRIDSAGSSPRASEGTGAGMQRPEPRPTVTRAEGGSQVFLEFNLPSDGTEPAQVATRLRDAMGTAHRSATLTCELASGEVKVFRWSGPAGSILETTVPWWNDRAKFVNLTTTTNEPQVAASILVDPEAAFGLRIRFDGVRQMVTVADPTRAGALERAEELLGAFATDETYSAELARRVNEINLDEEPIHADCQASADRKSLHNLVYALEPGAALALSTYLRESAAYERAIADGADSSIRASAVEPQSDALVRTLALALPPRFTTVLLDNAEVFRHRLAPGKSAQIQLIQEDLLVDRWDFSAVDQAAMHKDVGEPDYGPAAANA